MSGIHMLLVLIVREAALRSTLVARLSMGGAVIWTAQRLDAELPASMRSPTVLVTDEETVDAHEGGITALCDDGRWSVVVLLISGTPPTSDDGRLFYVERSNAAVALTGLLTNLRR